MSGAILTSLGGLATYYIDGKTAGKKAEAEGRGKSGKRRGSVVNNCRGAKKVIKAPASMWVNIAVLGSKVPAGKR